MPVEEGQKKFEELTQAPEAKPLEEIGTKEIPKKSKRKAVKALVPKNK